MDTLGYVDTEFWESHLSRYGSQCDVKGALSYHQGSFGRAITNPFTIHPFVPHNKVERPLRCMDSPYQVVSG